MTTQSLNNSLNNFPRLSVTKSIKSEPSEEDEPRLAFKDVKPVLVALSAILYLLAIWFGLEGLNTNARIVLITFGLTIIAWSFTKINDTYIALVSALIISFAGIVEPAKFFTSLGDSTIWLMLSSFIIAAAVAAAGLTDRLTKMVLTRAKTISGLFYGLTAAIMLSAFIVPSTSGRAALLLPVFVALCRVIKERRIRVALSILFPSVILLSAIASLTGAGAHLVTAEIAHINGGEKFTFGRWMMLGLPFALVSCFSTTFIILRLFLGADERRREVRIDENIISTVGSASGRWTAKEKFALGVVIVLIGLWVTESLHGLNSTFAALFGAMILTMPHIGTIKFKEAIKQINWNLLLFMAATLEMGEALIESGAAKWLIERSFTAMQSYFEGNAFAVVLIVSIVSLLSHLLINSRTARSSVLVPMVFMLGVSLGLNSSALAFISTAAAGFCLTLTVSAKPVIMFGQYEGDTFSQSDLLRLSSILFPLHLLLLMIFAFFVFPLLGLDIHTVNKGLIHPH